jgi:hypothetical protein
MRNPICKPVPRFGLLLVALVVLTARGRGHANGQRLALTASAICADVAP